jgi:N-acetylglucosaminyldiphosphoundecaprenol N-acetyl-beta-D-mannosaminyltransferase
MRIDLLGAPVDVLSLGETVARARQAMKDRSPTFQVSLNVAKLINMRRDPDLRQDVISADIISADGMGLVLASRLLARKLPCRVAGIDLMMELLAMCAREGFRPYFLGATDQVLRSAEAVALHRFPGLRLAGRHDGYFKPEQEANIVSEIRASRADCLFVAISTPRKERFLAQHRHALGVPFVMGVGGSFDILAGKVRRAPAWMQKSGLEWAYRIYQEPRRMWWRYAKTNTVFAWLLAKALVQSAEKSLRRSTAAT